MLLSIQSARKWNTCKPSSRLQTLSVMITDPCLAPHYDLLMINECVWTTCAVLLHDSKLASSQIHDLLMTSSTPLPLQASGSLKFLHFSISAMLDCSSVCLSVCPSVMSVICGHICWSILKVSTWIIIFLLGCFWSLTESWIRTIEWYRNQWPWMTLKDYMFENMCSFCSLPQKFE